MATKTFYFVNAVPSGATLHRSLQDGGSAPTTASTTTGWVADQKAIAQSCLQNGGSIVSRTDGQWGTTLQPNAAPSQTVGDGWCSENTLSGTFANSNWTFTFGIRSTVAYVGRLKLAVRVYRCTGANGTGATQMTAGRVASSATTANLSTSADTTVTVTWTPGATHTLTNEYLFVTLGLEVTAAGSANTQDVIFRVGSAYTVVTPNFAPSHPTTGVIAGPGATVVGTAARAAPAGPPITGAQSYILAPGVYFADDSFTSTILAPGVYVTGVGGSSGTAHATSGALIGSGKVIVGTAARSRVHATTGAVIAYPLTFKQIIGTAVHNPGHAAAGAIAGAAALVGVASSKTTRTTVGTPHGAGATLAGTAAHGTAGTSGFSSYILAPGVYLTDADNTSYILAPGVYVAGTAAAVATVHAATGALIGTGKVIAGTSAIKKLHATSGAPHGPGPVVGGAGGRNIPGAGAVSYIVAPGVYFTDASGGQSFALAPGVYVTGIGAIPDVPDVHPTLGALIGTGKVLVGVAGHPRIGRITWLELELPGDVHVTTGALTGPGRTLTGTAQRSRAHATSGALTGTGKIVAGVAQHRPKHVTTGVVVGSGKVIAGTAARTRGHANSGALIGAGKVINGVADRSRPGTAHTTDGALDQTATLVGVAIHVAIHVAIGALAGANASLAGTARRGRAHAASGLLAATALSVLHGTATRAHKATGAIAGAGAQLAGAVFHRNSHSVVGVLRAGPELHGAAARIRIHTSSGTLTGTGKVLAGLADRSRAPAVHPTSGALIGTGKLIAGVVHHRANHVISAGPVGPGAVLAGIARRYRTHVGNGVLIGTGKVIHGLADRSTPAATHTASGTLVGSGAALAGTAHHRQQHATTGVLVGAGRVIVGLVNRSRAGASHATSGTLGGAGRIVAGAAQRVQGSGGPVAHASTGALGGHAILAGTALHKAGHLTSGILLGPGAAVLGVAHHRAIHVTTGALVGPGSRIVGAGSKLLPDVGATWGTFPEWWPRRKQKREDELEDKLERIVKAAPVSDKAEQVLRELARDLQQDRIEVEQLRALVAARLRADHLRVTQAALNAARALATAKREAAALALEQERMETQRVQQLRRKKILHILQMLR